MPLARLGSFEAKADVSVGAAGRRWLRLLTDSRMFTDCDGKT